ncbi:hypothetical protein, partial [Actinomyces graevenitzii]|uniref:hypothetical protein n=1 Tax=Actinomyces graevenitzii TaxID=55565 RepID=UPI001E64C03F
LAATYVAASFVVMGCLTVRYTQKTSAQKCTKNNKSIAIFAQNPIFPTSHENLLHNCNYRTKFVAQVT